MSIREMLTIARSALVDRRIPPDIERALALGQAGDAAALRTVEVWLLAQELVGLPLSVAADLVDAIAGSAAAATAVERWLAAAPPMAISVTVRAEVQRRLEAARAAHRPLDEQRRELAREVVGFARESMAASRQANDPKLLGAALAATMRAFDVLEPMRDADPKAGGVSLDVLTAARTAAEANDATQPDDEPAPADE